MWRHSYRKDKDITPLMCKLNEYINDNPSVRVLELCTDDWDDYINHVNCVIASGGKIWFTDKEVKAKGEK